MAGVLQFPINTVMEVSISSLYTSLLPRIDTQIVNEACLDCISG